MLAVLAPLCLATALASDELSFHPKADSELAKKLEIKVNGEAVSPDEMDMGDSHFLVNMAVGVTDKFVETKEGKPLDLLRTFDEMSLNLRTGEEKHAVDEFSAIQGKTVRFKWNADSKAYDKSFHESKGDDDAIADLVDDMDLRVLLPEKKVAEGDTWEVTAEHLVPLFVPGGIAAKPPAGEDGQAFKAVEEELKAKLEPVLKDFKVQCKYKGLHEDGGAKYGEIRFSFDGKAKLDLSDLAARLAEIGGEEEGPKPDIQSQVNLALKGEGTLLWDQAAGHLHSFEMQAELNGDFEGHVKMDFDGEHFEESMKGEVLGKAKWSLALGK
jgi:hypothetical protein